MNFSWERVLCSLFASDFFVDRWLNKIVFPLRLRCEPFLKIVKIVFSVSRLFRHICALIC